MYTEKYIFRGNAMPAGVGEIARNKTAEPIDIRLVAR